MFLFLLPVMITRIALTSICVFEPIPRRSTFFCFSCSRFLALSLQSFVSPPSSPYLAFVSSVICPCDRLSCPSFLTATANFFSCSVQFLTRLASQTVSTSCYFSSLFCIRPRPSIFASTFHLSHRVRPLCSLLFSPPLCMYFNPHYLPSDRYP